MENIHNVEMVSKLNSALKGLSLDVKCVNAFSHRHFRYYDVTLGDSCRLSRLQNLAGEIALKINSSSDPIMKSLREEGIVRLQVVQGIPEVLPFYDLHQKAIVQGQPTGLLPFILGETDEGKFLWNDMAANPHMLVAGATGSGKSIALHCLIANALVRDDCQLMLSDPKGVEFERYRDPRLEDIVGNVAHSYLETIQMLEGLVEDMERRYEALKVAKLTSIEQEPDIFSKILVIIDEVADLMMMDDKSKRLQNLIIQLAQKSRAAGIYLVLATQRPSADIMSGLIKANLDARLACKVATKVDSRVVLDQHGAESLVGRGDAVIKNRNHDMVRFQVAYVTPQEIVKNYVMSNS
jgi:S-DNA-T family DNA segregation ATPase FtsK/SpoIIIE